MTKRTLEYASHCVPTAELFWPNVVSTRRTVMNVK
jgi:hypothetical protein